MNNRNSPTNMGLLFIVAGIAAGIASYVFSGGAIISALVVALALIFVGVLIMAGVIKLGPRR